MVRHWARVKGVLPERLELCCLPAALPLIAHFIVPLLRCCIIKSSTVNKHFAEAFLMKACFYHFVINTLKILTAARSIFIRKNFIRHRYDVERMNSNDTGVIKLPTVMSI